MQKIVECSVDNAQDVEVLEYSKGEISHEHDKSEEQDEIEVLFERVKSTDKSTEFISLGEESHGFGRKRKRRKKKILGKLPSKNDDSAQLRYFSADSQGGTNGSNIVANLAFKTKKQKAKYQKSLKAAAIRMCLNAAHSQVNFPKGTEKFNGKATSIPALSSDKINLAVKVPVRNEPRIVTIGKKKSKRNKSIVESRETDYIPLPITHSQSPTCSGQNSCTSGPALLNTIIARKLRPIVIDGPNVAMK